MSYIVFRWFTVCCFTLQSFLVFLLLGRFQCFSSPGSFPCLNLIYIFLGPLQWSHDMFSISSDWCWCQTTKPEPSNPGQTPSLFYPNATSQLLRHVQPHIFRWIIEHTENCQMLHNKIEGQWVNFQNMDKQKTFYCYLDAPWPSYLEDRRGSKVGFVWIDRNQGLWKSSLR